LGDQRELTTSPRFCETSDVLRHHHPDSVAERIDDIMAAVFMTDDRKRLERLAENVTADFVYISPGAVVDGAQGLSDAFSHFRHDSWRHTELHRTSVVDVHHAHFRYSWERCEAGETTMEGWSFGWMEDRGRIARIVSFDGLVPGQRQ
jgi:hypothetical protein